MYCIMISRMDIHYTYNNYNYNVWYHGWLYGYTLHIQQLQLVYGIKISRTDIHYTYNKYNNNVLYHD